MLNFIAQGGMATGVVDLTDELAILLAGLIGAVGCLAGVLMVIAVRDQRVQHPQPDMVETPAPAEYRPAA
jgi:hypothetical protein